MTAFVPQPNSRLPTRRSTDHDSNGQVLFEQRLVHFHKDIGDESETSQVQVDAALFAIAYHCCIVYHVSITLCAILGMRSHYIVDTWSSG
jgi:hypothetical protein